MQHVFLSPHLDDAVVSCGGTIAKLIYQRENVLVATIYTKNPDIRKLPKKLHKFAIYDQRKKEDKKALDRLSVDYKWLDLEERAYRMPVLKKPTDIFKIKLKEGLEQFSNIYKIHAVLDKLIEKYPKAKFYAPLAMGNHYDHVEVFLAVLMYMVDYAIFNKFLFYVDFYGMISTKIRRKHYLGNKVIAIGTKKPENSSLKLFMISSVMNAMIKGNSIEKMLPAKYLDIDWELKTSTIKGYENLKITALECYESQIKLFGKKVLKKFFNDYHKTWNNSELFLEAKSGL